MRFIGPDGVEQSLLSARDAAEAILETRLTAESLVFSDAHNKWVPAKDHFDLRALFTIEEPVQTYESHAPDSSLQRMIPFPTWIPILGAVKEPPARGRGS